MLYHSHTPEEALREVKATAAGLSQHDASQRARRFGANRIATSHSAELSRPLDNAYLLVLLLACGFAMMIDQLIVAALIAGSILVNIGLRFLQYRTLRSLYETEHDYTTLVKRDGIGVDISVHDVVPGDIVILSAGTVIPADGRILHAAALHVNEFQLTGDSQAIEKQIQPVHSDSTIADRASMVYRGSVVTSGMGEFVVTATGTQTEYSRIVSHSSRLHKSSSFQQRVARMMQQIVIFSLCVTAVLIAINLIRGGAWYTSVEYGIVLIVAAIPIMLPVVIAIITTQGIAMLGTHHARVSSLRTIEHLSILTTLVIGRKNFLTSPSPKIAELWHPKLSSSAFVSLISHTVAWHPSERDEIDQAIARVYAPAHVSQPATQLLFEQKIGMSGNVWHQSNSYQLTLKGTPEKILPRCKLTDAQRKSIDEQIDMFTEKNQQVLAVASFESPTDIASFDDIPSSQKLVFAGLVAFDYKIEPGAKYILARLAQAGVTTRLLTSATAAGAAKLAESVGISKSRNDTIDTRRLDESSSTATVRDALVYSHATPVTSEHVVASLKQHDVVAVTGQATKDLPRLSRAHIGISLNDNTSLVQEVSDVVLSSRSQHLGALYQAITSARVIMSNIRRILHYTLTTNLAELTVIVVALLFTLPVALSPPQILWANLIIYTILVLGLSIEPTSRHIMKRRPANPRARLVPAYLGARICILAAVMAATTIGVFFLALQKYELAYAQALAFHAFVVLQVISVLAARSDHTSLFVRFRTWSPAVYISVLCIAVIHTCMIFTPLGTWLVGAHLSAGDSIAVTVAALAIFITASELTKLYSRRMIRKVEEERTS